MRRAFRHALVRLQSSAPAIIAQLPRTGCAALSRTTAESSKHVSTASSSCRCNTTSSTARAGGSNIASNEVASNTGRGLVDAYEPLSMRQQFQLGNQFMPRPIFHPKPDASRLRNTAMLLCASTAFYVGARTTDSVKTFEEKTIAGLLSGLTSFPAVSNWRIAHAEAPGTTPLDIPFKAYAIADAAAKAAPAVVNILIESSEGPYTAASTGSGFIYDSDGLIITNAHVVSDPMHRSYRRSPLRGGPGAPTQRPVTVTLQDGRVFNGKVVATDPVTDLALVKVCSTEPLPVVQLGSSAQLRAGEWVVALGSPLHLQNSVTHGIISCVDRKAADLGLVDARTDYLQTDAAVNTGNSGGPLVNLQGQVIGINSLKAVAADGVSFAIPVDTAKEVVAQLLRVGRVVRPYVGIKMLQLTSTNVKRFRERDPDFPDLQQGILVTGVTLGSPAEKAGLLEGDCITGFNGSYAGDVSTSRLIKELQGHVGKTFKVQVRRGGRVLELEVPVAEADNTFAAEALPIPTGRPHGTAMMQQQRRRMLW